MAAQSGIPAMLLMENAGGVIADKASELLNGSDGGRVICFCGKGNNGGDGLVAARNLKRSGFETDVFLICKGHEIKGEAAVNLQSYIDSGGKVVEILSEKGIASLRKNLNADLIIDALLGTGFSGKVTGVLKSLIELLNSSGIPILAVDVPSGLDATTGDVDPVAIKAGWTLSFALPKKGFYKNRGRNHTGSVEVKNIGFPEDLLKDAVRYEAGICGK